MNKQVEYQVCSYARCFAICPNLRRITQGLRLTPKLRGNVSE